MPLSVYWAPTEPPATLAMRVVAVVVAAFEAVEFPMCTMQEVEQEGQEQKQEEQEVGQEVDQVQEMVTVMVMVMVVAIIRLLRRRRRRSAIFAAGLRWRKRRQGSL